MLVYMGFARTSFMASNLVKSLQMIPFPQNKDVVIRKEILSELEMKLPVSSQDHSAALWGLGGSGYAMLFFRPT